MIRATRSYINALMASNQTYGRNRMTSRLQSKNTSWLPGAQTFNKVSSEQVNYQNMKNNAGSVQSTAAKLTGTGEDSVFAKAKESGDTTEVVNKVKEFVSQYNSMVKNLKSGGSRVDSSYLNQLNAYATMSRSALQATGVTKQADGTLAVNDKTLRGASLEQLEKTWGSDSSFAAKAGYVAVNVQASAVSSINSLVSNSYSNLLQSFGTRGNFFNFFM
ncbi:MAG: hypothetical protein J1F41_04025 [Lachnospiraceae bacterium]|nr:hypothetical protein [Lachnospiraceae bacterium]